MSEKIPSANDNISRQERIEASERSLEGTKWEHWETNRAEIVNFNAVRGVRNLAETIARLKNAQEDLKELPRAQVLDEVDVVTLSESRHHVEALQKEAEALKASIDAGHIPMEEKAADLFRRIEETLRTLPTKESLEAARRRA